MTMIKHFPLKLLFTFVWVLTLSWISPHMSKAETVVDQLMFKIEQRLTQKYHLEAIGVSVGMPGGIVKTLGLKFQIQGPLSKNELRRFLISSAQDFVNDVNANQDIQPFLEKHPFGFDNVEIVFFLIDANGYEVDHPHIGIAGIRRGKLDYTSLVTVNNIPKIVVEEWETYEEAVQILQEQAASNSNSPT